MRRNLTRRSFVKAGSAAAPANSATVIMQPFMSSDDESYSTYVQMS